jgi:3-deoxy-manno-octulosonate cytidylyltransferase (CMP-KDO synthetase)
VLEAGRRIRVVVVDYSPIGVDTPEDLERVRKLLAAEDE